MSYYGLAPRCNSEARAGVVTSYHQSHRVHRLKTCRQWGSGAQSLVGRHDRKPTLKICGGGYRGILREFNLSHPVAICGLLRRSLFRWSRITFAASAGGQAAEPAGGCTLAEDAVDTERARRRAGYPHSGDGTRMQNRKHPDRASLVCTPAGQTARAIAEVLASAGQERRGKRAVAPTPAASRGDRAPGPTHENPARVCVCRESEAIVEPGGKRPFTGDELNQNPGGRAGPKWTAGMERIGSLRRVQNSRYSKPAAMDQEGGSLKPAEHRSAEQFV